MLLSRFFQPTKEAFLNPLALKWFQKLGLFSSFSKFLQRRHSPFQQQRMSDAVKPDTCSGTEGVEAARSVQVQPATMPSSPPASIPTTASHEFLEFEGTTSPNVSIHPLAQEREAVHLARELGEQETMVSTVCSTELSFDDYVDSSNVLLNASASDYVECFRDLFDSASSDSANIPCTLQHYKDGVFQLQLVVKVQVLLKSRKATYSFQLLPISVERIDVLESKLRDLQDEVDALRASGQSTSGRQDSAIQKLEESAQKLQKGLIEHGTAIPQLKQETKALHLALEESVVFSVQATTKVQGELICWKNSAFVFGLNANVPNVPNVTGGLDGIVRVQTPGMYQVSVVVNHQATAHNMAIDVMKGSEIIQTAFAGFDQGHYGSTSLTYTARLDKADQLKVKCAAQLVQSSYLTLVRLGK